jgi:hypothetical protein
MGCPCAAALDKSFLAHAALFAGDFDESNGAVWKPQGSTQVAEVRGQGRSILPTVTR